MVVIVGEDFLKFGQELAEIVQDLLAAGRAGQLDVLTDELFQGGDVVLVLHRFEADGLLVHPLVEVPVLIQHIGDAAGHAGCKVLAGLAQNDDSAAGQPWSPTPSTTATAPELRTQKRSPATPETKALPLVAP